ncbi:sulfotransferase [Mesorhizobium sp. ANAO-SY3R2]|uniref:sulfotransferase n=1 Tax=Mesorhizobium sp. ANAO-SY3R2 TaxID=3166644 RepID=UPI00366FDC13
MAEHSDVFSVPYETAVFGNANRGQRWGKLAWLLIRAQLSGKPLWIEKTPGHILHTDTISRVMPNAKFIVATRDGRDTVASLGKRYGSFERAFKRWAKDSTASKLRIQNGSSFLWRYEDFIELPARSIEDLCSFLGISYDEAMLDYHKRPTAWGQKAIRKMSEHASRRQAQVNQPIRDYRGKWKHELPPEVVSWFDHDDARELMEFFGYR